MLLFLSFFVWMTSGQQLRGSIHNNRAGGEVACFRSEVSKGGGGTGALCTGFTLVTNMREKNPAQC
jgi:hypothetical protein